MVDILAAVREAELRFARDHPLFSHLIGIPEEVYLRNRVPLDTKTATKLAVAKTSYPELTRPISHRNARRTQPPTVRQAPPPPPPTDMPSWPTAWDAFSHPLQSYDRYVASWRMQGPRYLRDPIGATRADFQSYRSNGRVLDLVGGRVEGAIADTPVMLAKAFDATLDHLPRIPRALGGPDPDFPAPEPERRKFAPRIEKAMLPLSQDAALRPPTTLAEHGVALATDAAMLLGTPESAGPGFINESRVAFGELRSAAAEFRAALAKAKNWDKAFAAMSARGKAVLSRYWLRAGRARTTQQKTPQHGESP
jgi:hypothetical protein